MNKQTIPAPPLPPLRYPLPPGVRPLTPYKRRPQPLIDLAAHDKRVLAEAEAKAAAPQPEPEPQPAEPIPETVPPGYDASEFPGAEPETRRPGRPRKHF